MVVRWWRLRGTGWLGRAALNALGAFTTAVVLLVIVISKFDEGAWTVVIAIPVLVILLARIRGRYRRVYSSMAIDPASVHAITVPARSPAIGNTSIVWIPSFSQPTLQALAYAATVSDRVLGVWVRAEEDDPGQIRQRWTSLVGTDPNLTLRIVESPYASLEHPEQTLTIVMPMAIPRYRFDSLLLNQRGINMRLALDERHNRVFTLVRYYLPA
jgi:hypothetical protein